MKTSDAVQRFALPKAVVQSGQAGVSEILVLPRTAVQQNPAQARFLYQQLGGGYSFVHERGREDKHVSRLY